VLIEETGEERKYDYVMSINPRRAITYRREVWRQEFASRPIGNDRSGDRVTGTGDRRGRTYREAERGGESNIFFKKPKYCEAREGSEGAGQGRREGSRGRLGCSAIER
jgi:hypothetical protein